MTLLGLGATASFALAGPLRIGVLTDNKEPEFAAALRVGTERARAALERDDSPIELIAHRSAKNDDRAGQAALAEKLVQEKVDALVIDLIDRQVMQPALEQAAAAHIPVVLVNAPAETPLVACVVASDNREAGRQAARRLAALLGGKGGVLLLRHGIYATENEQREEGFIEAVTREFPGLTLVASDYHAGATAEAAGRVSESLLHRYGEKIEGVFATSESATVGMLAALRKTGRAGGKVKLLGVDEGGPALAAALQAGDVQGYVREDPATMGFEGLQAAIRACRGEKIAPAIARPLSWVDRKGSTAIAPPEVARTAAELRSMVAPAMERPHLAGKFPVLKGAPGNAENFSVPGLELAMIAVAPGSFVRHGDGEESSTVPPARITLTRPYWLGACEVTQLQWTAIMGANPSDFAGDWRPVENVAWTQAEEFCRRLTARERAAGRLPAGYAYTLPTEAQWEYAARAGQPLPAIAQVFADAWCATNSGAPDPASGVWRLATHVVAQKPPNAWGFYDLEGNVTEWCADVSDAYPAGDATDPAGPAKGTYRVLRGGCWWADVQNCQSISRHKGPPGRHHSGLGLRVALAAVAASSASP